MLGACEAEFPDLVKGIRIQSLIKRFCMDTSDKKAIGSLSKCRFHISCPIKKRKCYPGI